MLPKIIQLIQAALISLGLITASCYLSALGHLNTSLDLIMEWINYSFKHFFPAIVYYDHLKAVAWIVQKGQGIKTVR